MAREKRYYDYIITNNSAALYVRRGVFVSAFLQYKLSEL
jgi:hypothetical protein